MEYKAYSRSFKYMQICAFFVTCDLPAADEYLQHVLLVLLQDQQDRITGATNTLTVPVLSSLQ